jgi:hypothetical protein
MFDSNLRKLEQKYVNEFMEAYEKAASGKLTFKEVMKLGFLNYKIGDAQGYDEHHFSEERLNHHVRAIDVERVDDEYMGLKYFLVLEDLDEK